MDTTQMLGNEQLKDFENRIHLFDDTVFEGNSDSYTIMAGQCIGYGGESIVYKAKRKSDGQEFVAKIYDQFQDTKPNRSNRRKVIECVQAHFNYKEDHLLPIIDYGKITVESDDGEDYHLPIDIIPFCPDGEIKKADYNLLKQKIIPSVVRAIHILHENNIIHRDIKPGNLYWYNGEVVVADFGTACEVGAETNVHFTVLKRGTLGYAAPEVWTGYADSSSDYFSFGCTVATLYKGEHVYQKLMDNSDPGAINSAIHSNGLPLACPASDKPLQYLVDALTNIDKKRRAGYEDVLLWLNDPKAFELHYKGKYERKNTSFSFTFEDVKYDNLADLADAMVENWEQAKTYLYRGGVQKSLLVNAFSQSNQSLAKKLGDIIEGKDTATNYNFGLAKAIHYLYDGGPLVWKGKRYDKFSDIAKVISEKSVPESDIIAMLSSKYLSWKMGKGKYSSEQKNVVSSIETVAGEYRKLAYHMAKYFFADSTRELTYNGMKTADKIFVNRVSNVSELYNHITEKIDDDEMLAYLAYLKNIEVILRYKRHISQCEDANEGLGYFYRLFEGISDIKKYVRNHYIKYGPLSYLDWIKHNLSLYDFNGSQANKTKNLIESVNYSDTMTIDEITNCFLKQKEYVKDLRSQFQGNIMLAYLGFSVEGKNITSNNSDAFFVEEFLGVPVPAGFIRYISAS